MQSCHRVVNWTPFSGVALRPLRKRQELQGLLPGEQGCLEQGPEELQGAKYPRVGVLWG